MILVAHSFGCLAALHWTVQTKEAVAAVLLVAPADPDKFGVRDLLPDHALPFPVTLIASRNDPWMPQGSAIDWARAGAPSSLTLARPAISTLTPTSATGTLA